MQRETVRQQSESDRIDVFQDCTGANRQGLE